MTTETINVVVAKKAILTFKVEIDMTYNCGVQLTPKLVAIDGQTHFPQDIPVNEGSLERCSKVGLFLEARNERITEHGSGGEYIDEPQVEAAAYIAEHKARERLGYVG